MKIRSKLLLAAVSLLTVSVAATATSAYAWYTANRKVEGNVTSIGVQSTSGSLSIEHGENDSFGTSGAAVVTSSGDKPVLTASSVLNITDVSSSGDGTFVKPKFGADGSTIVGKYEPSGGEFKGQKKVTLIEGVEAYGVVTLAMTLKNSGDNGKSKPISVYLSPKNASLTGSVDSIHKSARFSIYDVDASKTVFYCSPTAEAETAYNYLPTYDGVATTLPEGTKVLDKKEFFTNSKNLVTTSDSTNNIADNGYLCTIDAKGSHNYLITMWVEGTDGDCKLGSAATNAAVGTLKLGFDLYALEA